MSVFVQAANLTACDIWYLCSSSCVWTKNLKAELKFGPTSYNTQKSTLRFICLVLVSFGHKKGF